MGHRHPFEPRSWGAAGGLDAKGRTVRHTSHGNRPLSGSPPRSPLSVKTEGRRDPTKVPVRTVPVRARRPLGCGEDAPPRRGGGSSACRSRAGSSCTPTAAASCRCDTSAACAYSSRRQPAADVFSRLVTSAIRSGQRSNRARGRPGTGTTITPGTQGVMARARRSRTASRDRPASSIRLAAGHDPAGSPAHSCSTTVT